MVSMEGRVWEERDSYMGRDGDARGDGMRLSR